MEQYLESKPVFWLVSALAIFLFVVTNLPWQLDDYDQAKQAFTSLEMVKDGHWFYQHTPHERVATKPPLVGWISAAVFTVTRSWEVAWRLPSILAAIGLFILLFRVARFAYGKWAGLLAASAFGFNLLTPRLASLVRTDMPLALLIFLIGLLIWRKIRNNQGWEHRDRRAIFFLLTAAMLIKGPIVYAFLLPGIVLTQWRRRPDDHYSAWCGWWPWIGSLAIFLVWVFAGIVFERGFFDQVVMREFLGRFGETVHRPQPLLFYLPHLLHKFFPWSVLMIAVATIELQSRQWRIRAAFRAMAPETFWLICWVFGGLILMSIIPSKRVDRIFPIIPPLCLLLAAQIACSHGSVSRSSASPDPEPTSNPPSPDSVAASGRVSPENESMRERTFHWSALALTASILFAGGYAALKVVSGYRENRGALASFGWQANRELASRGWRYAVVKSSDEGLLPYLRKTHFVRSEQAVAEWNRGNLDALVVPAKEAPRLMRELQDAALSGLRSNTRKNASSLNYVLITR